MPEFRTLDAGAARIRVAIEGTGPLVLMVHGFPESWYSWRHQIGPIAAAGFTAAAMDVRGYGGSTRFPEVADYRMEALVADILGVGAALSPDTPFTLIGHDWGAPQVWNTALT
ncbi:MAG: alpha/beta fold hydrolase, partial [Hyphomonas sp.]